MKVKSFMRDGLDLIPVEVEVTLVPGLPQISFMGLPDAAIKESVLRLKSAVRHQGFKWPSTMHLLVHLKPTHLRKSSRGLDLAVAAAVLWETGQLKPPDKVPFVYGELSLKGEVTMPDDLADVLEIPNQETVLTGTSSIGLAFNSLQISTLKDLQRPIVVTKANDEVHLMRPELPGFRFGPKAARLMEIIAAGEHATLICGPPGTGKTTIAATTALLLPDPPSETFLESRKLSKSFGGVLQWRPIVQPHHSISSLAMIGGSAPPTPGEITRAHGGVLIMDEFLEFEPSVQEALREPIESGVINIARRGEFRQFPAEFLLLATTNLCRCGRLTVESVLACSCPNYKRRNYLSRLLGPFVDRFAIVNFWNDPEFAEANIDLKTVQNRINRAVQFRKEDRMQEKPNSRIPAGEVESQLSAENKLFLSTITFRSRRRFQSTLLVARTLADLDQSKGIELKHLRESIRLCSEAFQDLERCRDQAT